MSPILNVRWVEASNRVYLIARAGDVYECWQCDLLGGREPFLADAAGMHSHLLLHYYEGTEVPAEGLTKLAHEAALRVAAIRYWAPRGAPAAWSIDELRLTRTSAYTYARLRLELAVLKATVLRPVDRLLARVEGWLQR